MKKETLEEAKERYLDSPTPHSYRLAVEFGAKWQQERMYSEEDMKSAFRMNDKDWICFEEWFEQFKKK